jgi:hypothetical protein
MLFQRIAVKLAGTSILKKKLRWNCQVVSIYLEGGEKVQKRKTAIGIILIAILLSTFLLIKLVAAEETGYRDISVQQARRMVKHNSGNIAILDVRNQSEYDLGHLYDAS